MPKKKTKKTKVFGRTVIRNPDGTFKKWMKNMPEIPLTDEKFQELPLRGEKK